MRSRGVADVLVIGAGIAGLAAARRAEELGLEAEILEAGPMPGGRAARDRNGLGMELGPTWLHAARENPLAPIARAMGFELVPAQLGPELFFGGEAPAVARLEAQIEAAAAAGLDVPASQVVLRDEAAEVAIGPLSMGIELEHVSTLDYVTLAAEREDVLLREGLDRFVAALADGVAIRCAHPVERIEWSAEGARAFAAGRVFAAPQMVITVSTGVLRSGAIVFDPALPPEVTTGLEALPMARFEKAVLELDDQQLRGIAPMTRARDLRDPHGVEWWLRPLDRPLAAALIGGMRARALLERSDAQVIETLAAALSRILDREIRPKASRVTRFSEDPRFLGSWSVARPGSARVRERNLACGALSFAGEAFDAKWGTTLAGAWNSGRRAVEELAL